MANCSRHIINKPKCKGCQIASLRAQLKKAQEELLAAKLSGENWQQTAQQAIERAEKAEALAKKTRIAIDAHLRTADARGWPCQIDDVLLEVLADAEALEQGG